MGSLCFAQPGLEFAPSPVPTADKKQSPYSKTMNGKELKGDRQLDFREKDELIRRKQENGSETMHGTETHGKDGMGVKMKRP